MDSKVNIFKRLLSRAKGAVAVEVLVLGGLVATMGVAVMSTFKSTGALEKRINQELEVIHLLEKTTHLLRDKANCEASLNGKNPVAGESLGLLVTADGDEILDVDDEYGTGSKGRITLTAMSIADYSAPLAYLKLEFTKVGSTSTTSSIKRSIPIRVALSGSNITSCISGDDNSVSAMCSSLGGTLTTDLTCSNLDLNSVTVSSPLLATPIASATPGKVTTSVLTVSTDRGATAPVLAGTPEDIGEVATQDWVIDYMKTVSTDDRKTIIDNLLASSAVDFEAATADTYNVLKTYLLEEFGVSPGSACAEGEAATSLSFNQTTGVLTFNCATTFYRSMDDAMTAICWALDYPNGYNTGTGKCY